MFALLRGPDGKRLLLNLDLCFCIQEGPAGEAVAIALSGHGVSTGEKFDMVQNELLQEEEPAP
jgi:hypothetical protein